MSLLQEMLPLLIPIFVIDVILAVAAVRHILRHPHYRFGNRAMWLVISLVILYTICQKVSDSRKSLKTWICPFQREVFSASLDKTGPGKQRQ